MSFCRGLHVTGRQEFCQKKHEVSLTCSTEKISEGGETPSALWCFCIYWAAPYIGTDDGKMPCPRPNRETSLFAFYSKPAIRTNAATMREPQCRTHCSVAAIWTKISILPVPICMYIYTNTRVWLYQMTQVPALPKRARVHGTCIFDLCRTPSATSLARLGMRLQHVAGFVQASKTKKASPESWFSMVGMHMF